MKKKVLFHTDFALANTGFGRAIKALLKHLYKTGKYEIVHYCMNLPVSHADLKRTPWRSIGCLPDNQQETQNYLNQFRPEEREPRFREMCYGAYYLDKIIADEKPDVYFGIQDIWGVDFAVGKKWFQELTSVIWTTLDSLPILPSAVEKAPLIKHYWIWSDFATKALHDLGHRHVKTVHGPIETAHFFRLTDDNKKQLRRFLGIPLDTYIIGFVFRNQLRKSVPNLLEGYKMFKEQQPNVKSALLFHTHFSEGWNIHKLAAEYGVKQEEILTTYVCRGCKNYEIKPFTGQDLDCKYCGGIKAQTTTNVIDGVSIEQLNQIYNLMDVYCHPFTSGGQEIPVEEAKLCELVTLVTNYSCGEELCYPEAASLVLDWTEYREHGTEFRKASTLPSSIARQLSLVYRSSAQQRAKWGKQAREWTIKNFSVESIGKKVEEIIDSAPKANATEAFNLEKDASVVIPYIEDNKEWVKTLYRKILKTEVLDSDSGLIHWLQRLSQGEQRLAIENYFRDVARNENLKAKGFDLEDWLNKDDKGKRVLVVMPESIGDIFIVSSILKSIRELYPDYSLYFATKPEYFEILDCNPHVTKVIPYVAQMENLVWLEGQWNHKGFFEIAYLPFVGTQRFLDYLHNGQDKIAYDIKTRMVTWNSGRLMKERQQADLEKKLEEALASS